MLQTGTGLRFYRWFWRFYRWFWLVGSVSSIIQVLQLRHHGMFGGVVAIAIVRGKLGPVTGSGSGPRCG